MRTEANKAELFYCSIDKGYYIRLNDEDIHFQTEKPNETELIEAIDSDNWDARFKDMNEGKTTRVSIRIYYDILGVVPPIRQTANSFYCGEAYSGNLHHYFFKENGKYFGQLKNINQ